MIFNAVGAGPPRGGGYIGRMDDRQRLTVMEEKIAYLEQALDALNGVVRELGDQAVDQQRTLAQLRETVRKLAEVQAPDPPDERPPHW